MSTMSGGYMYSRGFGYEKVDMGNGKMVKDAGLDSIRVKIGERNVPVGIEDALIGMKKGEKRRVELPPQLALSLQTGNRSPRRGEGKLVYRDTGEWWKGLLGLRLFQLPQFGT